MRKLMQDSEDPGRLSRDLSRDTGKSVTVKLSGGRAVSGELTEVGPRRLIVDGTSIPIAEIRFCLVRDGGDWITKGGHQETARTERIHLRCSEAQKQKLTVAASRAGKPLSAYVLDTVLGA